MNQQTTDYEKFVFLPFNRKRISETNVKVLIDSISKENLLEEFPVEVTERFEIINGQHRVLACKHLGIPVVYKIVDVKPENLIRMNSAKGWTMPDYLNYYCHFKHPEYLKILEFCEKYDMKVSNALELCKGKNSAQYGAFKNGDFVFDIKHEEQHMKILMETLSFLKTHIKSNFIQNARFTGAMMTVIKAEGFKANIWEKKVRLLVDRITIRARYNDYLQLFQNIYNYRNEDKISVYDRGNSI